MTPWPIWISKYWATAWLTARNASTGADPFAIMYSTVTPLPCAMKTRCILWSASVFVNNLILSNLLLPSNALFEVQVSCNPSSGCPTGYRTKLSLKLLWISRYFSYFLSLYLLDKETQRNNYLNPCSEFYLDFLDINYSQNDSNSQNIVLYLNSNLCSNFAFRLCLIQ